MRGRVRFKLATKTNPGQVQSAVDTVTGRLWNYVVDQRPWGGAHAPAALFRYSPDRKGERPQEHLAGYKGFLHADAYAGYKELYAPRIDGAPHIFHVACMAHARRYFFDAFEETKSPVAAEALRRIGELYAIEADINGKPADVRLAERQARAVPLLAAMKEWLEGERQRLSKKTGVATAIKYSLTRWDALTRYTTDGRLAIDNNVAERALRTVAVTRKSVSESPRLPLIWLDGARLRRRRFASPVAASSRAAARPAG